MHLDNENFIPLTNLQRAAILSVAALAAARVFESGWTALAAISAMVVLSFVALVQSIHNRLESIAAEAAERSASFDPHSFVREGESTVFNYAAQGPA